METSSAHSWIRSFLSSQVKTLTSGQQTTPKDFDCRQGLTAASLKNTLKLLQSPCYAQPARPFGTQFESAPFG
jgi:hypothetical protein